MLGTSLYCIIIAINPGYTHLDPYLVFYNLPCITERKSDYNAFFHLRIACNTPSPIPSLFPASNKMQKDCIQFLLDLTFFQRAIKNNPYANLWVEERRVGQAWRIWGYRKAPFPNYRVPKRQQILLLFQLVVTSRFNRRSATPTSRN